jgi:putative transposase
LTAKRHAKEKEYETIRHRTNRVKGAFSRTSLLSTLFKLAIGAEPSFRRLRGFNWLAEGIRVVKFIDGVREHQQLAAV